MVVLEAGAAAAVVNGVGWVVVNTGGVLAPIVGPALGFSSNGIVAGSLAAAAQSFYGNLAAGSVISQMTSLTMTAGGASIGLPVIGVAGAVGGVAYIYKSGGNLTDTVKSGAQYGGQAVGYVTSKMPSVGDASRSCFNTLKGWVPKSKL